VTPQVAHPFADQVQETGAENAPQVPEVRDAPGVSGQDERVALGALRDHAAPKAVFINGDKFKIIGVE